ncbi:hypothetical protein Zmor_000997 [Zophobas morio]|uniref:Uncharacterized protein n=1 Tax=Zophobas morio TaxID=2755281 RepID=A0AA38IYA1_9CUCU|nr:hypothetical protein Zmor_000997 [Zophobas morio]
MLCYGALVWWPRTRQKTTALQLEHVQRMACLCVTGAMRTTPTSALETLLCLASLNLYIEEAAMRTSLRLHSLGVWNKQGRTTKHTRILTEAFYRIPLSRVLTEWAQNQYMKRHIEYQRMIIQKEEPTSISMSMVPKQIVVQEPASIPNN